MACSRDAKGQKTGEPGCRLGWMQVVAESKDGCKSLKEDGLLLTLWSEWFNNKILIQHGLRRFRCNSLTEVIVFTTEVIGPRGDRETPDRDFAASVGAPCPVKLLQVGDAT